MRQFSRPRIYRSEVDGRRPGMKAHFARYSQAYFVGALFLIWQYLIAFKAQATGLTPSIRSTMGFFDWLVFQSNVALACLPTMIAFLNRSVATAAAGPGIAALPPADMTRLTATSPATAPSP